MNKIRFIFFFLLLSPFFSLLNADYRYSLVLCAIFKNEAPFFKEWIEYHKMLGVEHFRLYNNGSTDNSLEVLDPYIRNGDVTIVNWPSNHKVRNYSFVFATQWPAIRDALVHYTGVAKWLAIIDTDEFIVPLQHSNIPSFLNEYEDYGGVVINWQCFGTSWLPDLRQNMLQTETLLLKAPETSEWNHQVKSIVRPERVALQITKTIPHAWIYHDPYYGVAPNLQVHHFGLVDVSKIQINHYVHRSEKYFYENKIERKAYQEGRKWSTEFLEDWHRSCNQVEDTKIFRFLPALKERLGAG
ncbi:MAG TPA: glycosyltransferase family 92 protein [Rhabdochlamydiaceae bacterium]|nr:glycosyltransferase family 92 protein [Rhabdochlamydiaceae bacterium]